MHRRVISSLVAAAVALGAASCTGIVRVSTGFGGTEGNQNSDLPFLDATGHLVAFTSIATNLVANDTNGHTDAFVKDTQSGAISRVSVSSNEAQANGTSGSTGMSAEGRYVIFVSNATNLTPNPGTGAWNLYLRDRHTGSTRLLSQAANGDASNGTSIQSSVLSTDGSKVAFVSDATNLGGGPGSHLFVVDVATGAMTRIASLCPALPGRGPITALNANGSRLAWSETCTDSTHDAGSLRVYVRNLTTNADTLVFNYSWTDINNVYDSVGSLSFAGASSKLAILRIETSGAEGYDAATYISTGGTAAEYPTTDLLAGLVFSPNGQYLAYERHDDNPPDDPQELLKILDLAHGGALYTVSVTYDSSAGPGPRDGEQPTWSGDGSTLAFTSLANDLVPNDTNNAVDVFTRSLASTLQGGSAQTGTARVTG
jgi:Tol biopolymer transport system component